MNIKTDRQAQRNLDRLERALDRRENVGRRLPLLVLGLTALANAVMSLADNLRDHTHRK